MGKDTKRKYKHMKKILSKRKKFRQFRKYLIDNPTDAEILFRDALIREQIRLILNFRRERREEGIKRKDSEKEWVAIKKGYRVVRIENTKIYNKLDEVIKILKDWLQKKLLNEQRKHKI